jgi:two-component system, LuxR family, sensor kinase FixL
MNPRSDKPVRGDSDSGFQERDELFNALLETAVDGIIVIDPKGLIQIYNQACERLFGYRADEVVGRNVKLLMPAPYHQEHDGYLSHYRQTQERRIIGIGREVVGQRKDGSTFPMYLSVGEGTLGEQRLFVGIIHDLSAIRQEAAEREDANRLLAQIVQSSDDAIISKTLDGFITSWNASAERIFGYSAAEAFGKHISLLFPPDRIAEENEIMTQLRSGQNITHYETVRLHKDGREIMVSLSVAPIHDGSGAMIGASKVAREITERKRAEGHALALQDELAHVGRLSAMGQMSAAIAHELNQPLAAITNYVKAAQRLLEDDSPAPQKLRNAREATEKAAGQALRAGTIIRYLRDYVEKRESARSLENLNDVIHEAVTLAMMGHKHNNVRLTLALDPTIPPAALDKVQMQQVLLNLVRNAIEAMANTERPELTISSAADAAGVIIKVRDTGPGFSAEIAGRLFQPFVTTKVDGMGIGLKICQSIVEAHGGTIEATNGDPGAVFVIRLPRNLSETDRA